MDHNDAVPHSSITDKLKSFDFIRLCFVDLNGLHLSKLVSSRHAKKIAKGLCEMYAGMITFGPRMEVVDIPRVVELNHVNNLLIPDFDTLHACPWAGYQNRDSCYDKSATGSNPRIASVLCDLNWPDGQPMEAYPRTVVRRLLRELEEKYRLRLMSAFEPEFRAFRLDSMVPSCLHPTCTDFDPYRIPEPVPFTIGEDMYKTGLLAVYESFFMNVDRMLSAAGVDIQDCSNENGSGQLECPLMPEFGIQSADHYFIFKQAVKEIGVRHNMGISFMTTPFEETASSGCHFNHSLWTVGKETNAFYDAKSPNKLSQLARHWIGGLTEHLPAMLAICCPTVNCYRRLHHKLAPDVVNWDIDDRFVSIRVKNKDEKRTYIENRIPSSASCAYHVMAATLAAGLDGIERGLEPPPAGQKPEKGLSDVNRCRRLPNTLKEALELLREDHVFVKKLGSEFVDWFCQVKERGDLYSLKHDDFSNIYNIDLAKERYEYLLYS